LAEAMMSARRAWSLAAAWAFVIFVLSSIPAKTFPSIQPFGNFDKAVHLVLYAVLGALCLVAARKTWSTRTAWLVLTTSFLALVYGITDELHQSWVPGRSADPRDVLADGIGGVIGSLAAAWTSTRRRS
jgi:VanZ family protein